MKFIKVYSQNNKDFFLINLASVSHISVNKKSGTCMVSMNNGKTITCFPLQAHALLTQVSEYNRQIVEYLTTKPEDIEF